MRIAKKFLLVPGYVISRSDGQLHYVGVGALCRLYGVSLAECIVADIHGTWKLLLSEFEVTCLVRLAPRDDGQYRLVDVAKDRIL